MILFLEEKRRAAQGNFVVSCNENRRNDRDPTSRTKTNMKKKQHSSQIDLKDLIDTKQVDLNTAIVKRILRLDEVNEKACLVVLQGAEAGEIIPLDNKGVVIGRNRECDVVLKGEGISRTHAKFHLNESDQAVVRDLGSTNGTFLKGQRVAEAILEAGDTVLLGQDTVLSSCSRTK
jgi:pSer/pThr/pTyr-binding forkhead associated (FHA) protein